MRTSGTDRLMVFILCGKRIAWAGNPDQNLGRYPDGTNVPTQFTALRDDYGIVTKTMLCPSFFERKPTGDTAGPTAWMRGTSGANPKIDGWQIHSQHSPDGGPTNPEGLNVYVGYIHIYNQEHPFNAGQVASSPSRLTDENPDTLYLMADKSISAMRSGAMVQWFGHGNASGGAGGNRLWLDGHVRFVRPDEMGANDSAIGIPSLNWMIGTPRWELSGSSQFVW